MAPKKAAAFNRYINALKKASEKNTTKQNKPKTRDVKRIVKSKVDESKPQTSRLINDGLPVRKFLFKKVAPMIGEPDIEKALREGHGKSMDEILRNLQAQRQLRDMLKKQRELKKYAYGEPLAEPKKEAITTKSQLNDILLKLGGLSNKKELEQIVRALSNEGNIGKRLESLNQVQKELGRRHVEYMDSHKKHFQGYEQEAVLRRALGELDSAVKLLKPEVQLQVLQATDKSNINNVTAMTKSVREAMEKNPEILVSYQPPKVDDSAPHSNISAGRANGVAVRKQFEKMIDYEDFVAELKDQGIDATAFFRWVSKNYEVFGSANGYPDFKDVTGKQETIDDVLAKYSEKETKTARTKQFFENLLLLPPVIRPQQPRDGAASAAAATSSSPTISFETPTITTPPPAHTAPSTPKTPFEKHLEEQKERLEVKAREAEEQAKEESQPIATPISTGKKYQEIRKIIDTYFNTYKANAFAKKKITDYELAKYCITNQVAVNEGETAQKKYTISFTFPDGATKNITEMVRHLTEETGEGFKRGLHHGLLHLKKVSGKKTHDATVRLLRRAMKKM
jgi:hypothetical protein